MTSLANLCKRSVTSDFVDDTVAHVVAVLIGLAVGAGLALRSQLSRGGHSKAGEKGREND